MSAIDDYKEQYRCSPADLGPVLIVLKHGCHKLGSEDSFQWLPLVPTHWSLVGFVLGLSGVQLDDRQGSSRRLSADWRLWGCIHVFAYGDQYSVWSAGKVCGSR